ncbi:MAG TPA: hypothetical protein VHM30_02125 [Gemmatimonadaceae bacterium]|nr:hypothetical protein [Gemmatimonadaceae bacterium]
MRTSSLTIATIVLLAGCASSPSATRHDAMVVDANRNVFRSADYGIRASFNAPRDSVFTALAQAYADAGITPDMVDTKENIVSRKQILIPRVFNGKRASLLFSCGETATGQSLAENGQLYASVRSQITGEFDHPTVQTLVDGYVIPNGGTSSSALHCGSTGEIERWIREKTSVRLGVR